MENIEPPFKVFRNIFYYTVIFAFYWNDEPKITIYETDKLNKIAFIPKQFDNELNEAKQTAIEMYYNSSEKLKAKRLVQLRKENIDEVLEDLKNNPE